MRIFLTHVPDMLENYYGPRALAEMRKLGEVGSTRAARCSTRKRWRRPRRAARSSCRTARRRDRRSCSRWRPTAARSCASRSTSATSTSRRRASEGVLVTRATPGFMASVSEMAIGMMIDCARSITDATIAYRSGEEAEPRKGIQLQRRDRRHHGLRRDRAASRADLRRARHDGAGRRSVRHGRGQGAAPRAARDAARANPISSSAW